MPPDGVAEALDEVEDGVPCLGRRSKGAPLQKLALEGRKKLSHIALSKQSPTEPIEGRTPAWRHSEPKGTYVYWQPWSEW